MNLTYQVQPIAVREVESGVQMPVILFRVRPYNLRNVPDIVDPFDVAAFLKKLDLGTIFKEVLRH